MGGSNEARVSEWWIDEPLVKASMNPTDTMLGRLRAQGFTLLVSLLDEQRERPEYDVWSTVVAGWTRRTFEIPEGEAPTVGQLVEIIGTIRAAPSGTKALVHCSTGRGRAATIGAAYWIDAGLSPQAAISRVSAETGRGFVTADRERVLTDFATRKRTH